MNKKQINIALKNIENLLEENIGIKRKQLVIKRFSKYVQTLQINDKPLESKAILISDFFCIADNKEEIQKAIDFFITHPTAELIIGTSGHLGEKIRFDKLVRLNRIKTTIHCTDSNIKFKEYNKETPYSNESDKKCYTRIYHFTHLEKSNKKDN